MNWCGARLSHSRRCANKAVFRWGDGDQVVDLCFDHFQEALDVAEEVVGEAERIVGGAA